MDPMTKMWISLVGIGLMAVAAVLITISRYKLKGWLRMLVSVIAFGFLILGALLGFAAIM